MNRVACIIYASSAKKSTDLGAFLSELLKNKVHYTCNVKRLLKCLSKDRILFEANRKTGSNVILSCSKMYALSIRLGFVSYSVCEGSFHWLNYVKK